MILKTKFIKEVERKFKISNARRIKYNMYLSL